MNNTPSSSAFTIDRLVSRLAASWLLFSLGALATGGNFGDISYLRQLPVWAAALIIAALFAALSAASSKVKIHLDSWALAVGGTGSCFVWLMRYPNSSQRIYFAIGCIVVLCLIFAYFRHANRGLLDKLRLIAANKDRLALVWTAICGIVMFSSISIVTVLRYKSFAAPNFDFGLFVNMFHNMAESGLPMVTSERDMLLSHFAVHISPIYYLMLPAYLLFRSPVTLQLCQAAVVALGIIPVHMLSRRLGLSPWQKMLVSAIYAFYPALSTSCFYDLHENCFLPVCLLSMFLCYETKKFPLMYLFAALTLMVKEDSAVYILIFAVFIMLSEKSFFHGAVLAVTAVGYFAVCIALLNGFGMGAMSWRYENLIYGESGGLFGVISTAILNPGYVLSQSVTTSDGGAQKLLYLIQMLLPVGFLPFASKKASRWLLAAPVLINLLTMYGYQYDLGFQYHFGAAAFFVYAMIKNIPQIKPDIRAGALWLAVISCFCLYTTFVTREAAFRLSAYRSGRENFIAAEEFLDTIPEDSSVCASSMLVAHLADRDEIYELESHGNEPDVDFVVIDLRYENQSYIDAYTACGYTLYAEHENMIKVLKAPEQA